MEFKKCPVSVLYLVQKEWLRVLFIVMDTYVVKKQKPCGTVALCSVFMNANQLDTGVSPTDWTQSSLTKDLLFYSEFINIHMSWNQWQLTITYSMYIQKIRLKLQKGTSFSNLLIYLYPISFWRKEKLK